MKSQKGFTLVEVIVIAVIVAILALVGIQLYTGFINQARQDTVDNLAHTAAAAANTIPPSNIKFVFPRPVPIRRAHAPTRTAHCPHSTLRSFSFSNGSVLIT